MDRGRVLNRSWRLFSGRGGEMTDWLRFSNPAGKGTSRTDAEMRADNTAVSGEVFAITEEPGGLFALWVEDDGYWHQKLVAHRKFRPELAFVAKGDT